MRRFAYMVLYLCILCVTGIYAQNGREQVSAQGEQLFQHTIEQGQTVYSIATMYGVSVDDIYRLNPGSKEQIKSGEILLIPQKQHSKENTTEKKDEDGQYTYHTIKPRETLYSVSVRYQIPATRIIEANPDPVAYGRESRKDSREKGEDGKKGKRKRVHHQKKRDDVQHLPQVQCIEHRTDQAEPFPEKRTESRNGHQNPVTRDRRDYRDREQRLDRI